MLYQLSYSRAAPRISSLGTGGRERRPHRSLPVPNRQPRASVRRAGALEAPDLSRATRVTVT